MSYEGYNQHLCDNGHLFCEDCLTVRPTCPDCSARSCWSNGVDQTNNWGDGIIPSFEWEKLLLTPEVWEDSDLVVEATYKVPTDEQERLITYDGAWNYFDMSVIYTRHHDGARFSESGEPLPPSGTKAKALKRRYRGATPC